MRRSSRLTAGALALLSAFVTAGCGLSEGRAPLPGNVVTFAYDQQPECLDPQVSPKDVTGLVTRNMVDSLVSMEPDGTFHPWLAKRWEISEDGRDYTFHLRDDVLFHDGTRFDASAVAATLDHAVAPETKSQYAVALARGYQRTTVVDATTVRIRLERPNAAFLQALSSPYLGIQSPKAIRSAKGGLCGGPVGSGPLRFVEWARNHRLVMERNDEYRWNPGSARHRGPVRYDGLVIEFIDEDAARFGALTSGQVDAAGNIPPSKAATLDVTRGLRLHSTPVPGAVFNVVFNTTHGPLRDERLRRALMLSVDLDSLVETVFFGRNARAWSPLSPATPHYSARTEGSWRYDRREAARLLDAAGWTGRDEEGYRTKDGRRLTLSWPYAADLQAKADILGQGIQAEAKKSGIRLRWYPLDIGTYIKRTTAGRGLDMYSTSFVRAEPDILRFFHGSRETLAQGGGNVFGVDEPELDAALDAGAAATDPRERERAYARAQRYILDHALVMPVYVPTALVGASDRVRGLTFDASAYPLFHDVVREEP
ncbi:ABC transporter substrate-binding protein [Streptomyces sp. NPDC026589]|uniref:ABC transporter substrate-binding protein n=1 Tax=Streptomyces sp. NPDC026589 TaxID=3155609 RepID=UPI0033C2F96C